MAYEPPTRGRIVRLIRGALWSVSRISSQRKQGTKDNVGSNGMCILAVLASGLCVKANSNLRSSQSRNAIRPFASFAGTRRPIKIVTKSRHQGITGQGVFKTLTMLHGRRGPPFFWEGGCQEGRPYLYIHTYIFFWP